MTPDFQIIADGQDITAKIRDRLLELRVTDEAGLTSDAAEIRLDDRGGLIALPRKGAKLQVSLGYRESGLAAMGRFTVDELVLAGPPDTLTIRARAADLRAGMKSPKTRSWDGLTLGDLVAKIAAEHGYTPKVSAELAAIQLGHVDQTEESDLNLLTRLAGQYGAVAKPAGDRLLFVPAGEAKSASGKSLPTVALRRQDLSRWEATIADRGSYAAVTARYRDLAAATDVEVTAGSGEPVYALRHPYPDRAAAESAARSKLASLQRGEASISFSCLGDVRLAAEGQASLSGIREGVNGLWLLERVVHSFSPGRGYSADGEGKIPKETTNAGD